MQQHLDMRCRRSAGDVGSFVIRFAALGWACFGLSTGLTALSGCSPISPAAGGPGSSSYAQKRLEEQVGTQVRPVGFEKPSSTGSDFTSLPQQVNDQVKQITGLGPKPEQAKADYKEAEVQYSAAAQLHQQGKRSEARDKFLVAAAKYTAAARLWPDSAIEQDGMFMAAESSFFADRYTDASEAYERLLKKYPNSRHLDLAEARRFTIAQYWLELSEKQPHSWYWVNVADSTRPYRDTFGNAVRVFDRIRLDDPTGKLADDATFAAGSAFFTQKNFMRADEFFTDLRKAYPGSEHQFKAHLLGVESKLRNYQGPDYSGDALDEAEKLIKQVRRQFPAKAEEQREYLNTAYAKVRHLKAEREMKMARYHDWRGEYRAARHYYDVVVKQYGETRYAAKAGKRLAAIQGRPAVPAQKAPWLVWLFPDHTKDEPLLAKQPGETLQR